MAFERLYLVLYETRLSGVTAGDGPQRPFGLSRENAVQMYGTFAWLYHGKVLFMHAFTPERQIRRVSGLGEGYDKQRVDEDLPRRTSSICTNTA